MKSNMKQFGFISNNSDKANELYSKFSEKFDITLLNDTSLDLDIDAIIVAGGDGELLRALHNFHEYNLPFIGFNAGSVGFLTNTELTKSVLDELDDLKQETLYALHLEAEDKLGNKYSKIAFNDVVIHRASNQASKLSVKVDNDIKMNEIVSDGIIIATPAGSSAYNFSAGGRIIPLNSRAICITPVCAFRPRGWRGAIIPDTCSVEIDILENQKRPVYAVADFNEIKDIVKIKVTRSEKIKANLLFSSSQALNKRIIKEQFNF